MKLKLFFLISTIIFGLQAIPKYFKEIKCTLTPININKKYSKTEQPSVAKTTLNWAGYIAADNLINPTTNSVSAVFGSWKAPVISGPNNSIVVIWVGIDGYKSPTIEQIGTAHEIRNGSQVDFAWFAMNPNHSFQINNFIVRPNDSISASVKYKNNNQFVLQIINNTLQQFATVPLELTKIDAERITAQWIVESSQATTLANFGEIEFESCQATINTIKQSINQTTNCAENMVNSTMVKGFNNLDRSQARAIVSDLTNGGKNFKVKWLRK